jgi:hypothetical protein
MRPVPSRGVWSRSRGAAHALREDTGRQFHVAEEAEHHRARRRPRGRVRIQAPDRYLNERIWQDGNLSVAGWRPPGGGEHHRLSPGEHVAAWRSSSVWRGYAELDHARHTVVSHDHVLGAKVAVHEAGLVDRRQPGRHADGDRLEVGPGPDAITNDHLKQRRARNVLTDQVGLESLQAGVQDARGAKWRYSLGHCGLGGEPVSTGGVLGPVGPEHADRHVGAIRTDSDEDRVIGRNACDSPDQAVPSNPFGIAGAQRRLLGHNRFRLGKQVDPRGGFVPYALCASQCGESTKLLPSKRRCK